MASSLARRHGGHAHAFLAIRLLRRGALRTSISISVCTTTKALDPSCLCLVSCSGHRPNRRDGGRTHTFPSLPPPPPLFWSPLSTTQICSDVPSSLFAPPPRVFWSPLSSPTACSDVVSSSPPIFSDVVRSAPSSPFAPPPRVFGTPQAPPFHGRVTHRRRDGRHAFLLSHTATATLLDAVLLAALPTYRASYSSAAAGRAGPGVFAGAAISSEADTAVASKPCPPPTAREGTAQGPSSLLLQMEDASQRTGIWQRRPAQLWRTSPCRDVPAPAPPPLGSGLVLSGGLLPVHRGGNAGHGDQHAKPLDNDEIKEDEEEKKEDDQPFPNSSRSIELQPLNQGQHHVNQLGNIICCNQMHTLSVAMEGTSHTSKAISVHHCNACSQSAILRIELHLGLQ